MSLSLADRLDIHELLARHGHLVDDGELERMPEVFTDDVVYDVSDAGGGVLRGCAAIREAALALGGGNPVAHHVTNVVVTEDPSGLVRARSKGIGVRADGSTGSAVYEDELRREPDGWRIARRTVRIRRVPLTP